MNHSILEFLFWGAALILIYCFLGFPLLLLFWNILPHKSPVNNPSVQSSFISIIIAAYNEADNISSKLDSVLSSLHSDIHYEIIVASDGSTDGTNEIVQKYKSKGVKLLALPRMGKNSAINIAVSHSKGDILIFTDADSILSTSAITNLIKSFLDPTVGGVGGDYRHASKKISQEGERLYWNYDRLLKKLQSFRSSLSGVSGALYAVRRSLFKEIPPDVTDDFFTAMQVVSSHYRVIFQPDAIAYGPVASNAKEEFKRKVRIMTRGFHGVWLMKHLLNPINYGFFSIQLFTHKLLRRLLAIPLFITLFTATLLWDYNDFYKTASILQLIFHALALIGLLLMLMRFEKYKMFNIPFHVDMVYYASLVAIFNSIRRKRYSTWVTGRADN